MAPLTERERAEVLACAAACVVAAVRTGAAEPRPRRDPPFDAPAAPFVTLRTRVGGGLRGCIGRVAAVEPLGPALASMAAAAALEDPRFPPVTEEELPGLEVEVSLLRFEGEGLGPAADPLAAVRVGVHGLRIDHRGRSGLLLPQVATEHGLDARGFLDALCRKAGLPAGAWREPGAVVALFAAEVMGPVPVV